MTETSANPISGFSADVAVGNPFIKTNTYGNPSKYQTIAAFADFVRGGDRRGHLR